MSAGDFLINLLLGGTLGTLGQGIRAIVGLKKVYDTASGEGRNFSSLFQFETLIVSLFIGFITGVLGIFITGRTGSPIIIGNQFVFTLIGFGYAGTDFIEAFMKKTAPNVPAADTSDDTTAVG